MKVRTAKAIGAAIRQRRRELALDQLSLAKRIGASRQWVIGMEQGKDSAEIGRVLRTLDTLGLTVELSTLAVAPNPRSNISGRIDLNEIVARSKRSEPSVVKRTARPRRNK